jgi:hypothetical protein
MSPSKSKNNKRWYNYNERKPSEFDEEEVEDEGEAGGQHKKLRNDQGYLGNHPHHFHYSQIRFPRIRNSRSPKSRRASRQHTEKTRITSRYVHNCH